MLFDRTQNAKKTIQSGLLVKLLSTVVPFIMRTIIIYTLGNLYLGLGSLFSAILNTLNLAELGIGSAMVFSMYKPAAENDTKTICALLNVYKKIYLVIGTVVLIIGLGLLPFLPDLIHGKYPDDINIYVLYVMQLLSAVAGYFFFAYRGSILTAYQRADIANIVTFITEFFMYLLQALSLIVFRNYYMYVFLILLRSIVYNLIVFQIVKKRFPALVASGTIDQDIKKQIIEKTSALAGHKVAVVIINSTDNILISMLIGLNMVAIYNNYYSVVQAIAGILLLIFSGVTPIVGNYLITENNDRISSLFDTLNYLNAFIIVICCNCFMTMIQPFILLWTGEQNMFPMYMVVLFVVYFYTLRIRIVMNLFKDAAGIWEKDLVKAYAMALINLSIDIFLMQKIGIAAALISTIITMVFAFFYEAVVVHKYVLKSKILHFLRMNALYLFIAVISCFSSAILMKYSFDNTIARLLTGGFVGSMVGIVFFVCMTCRCREFKMSVTFVSDKLRRSR